MELNREQIIKALECCKTPLAIDCANCSYTGKGLEDGVYEGCVNCLVEDALALITSQEQRIFELENRLKECENGYEGTLYLDRCKLHDAEEKARELTAENESLAKSVNEASELIRRLRDDKKELTEEVASWKAIAEGYQKQFEDCAEDRARLTEENERLQAEAEKYKRNFEECSEQFDGFAKHAKRQFLKTKADIVRKMHERLKDGIIIEGVFPKSPYDMCRYIDQIAKEMLEGEK